MRLYDYTIFTALFDPILQNQWKRAVDFNAIDILTDQVTSYL